jgi:hypothetical protein
MHRRSDGGGFRAPLASALPWADNLLLRSRFNRTGGSMRTKQATVVAVLTTVLIASTFTTGFAAQKIKGARTGTTVDSVGKMEAPEGTGGPIVPGKITGVVELTAGECKKLGCTVMADRTCPAATKVHEGANGEKIVETGKKERCVCEGGGSSCIDEIGN